MATACSKITPTGFWINYKKDLITKKVNNQGPWGGTSEIKWKSNRINYFSTKEILAFAKQNGWQLTDSLIYKKHSIKPFTNYNEKDYSCQLLQIYLKKFNSTKNHVYIFNTDWLTIEPGNERETNKNGFIVISSDRKEFAVYHKWGE